MINNSTKDKLENETLHFGNTLLGAVLLTNFGKMKYIIYEMITPEHLQKVKQEGYGYTMAFRNGS